MRSDDFSSWHTAPRAPGGQTSASLMSPFTRSDFTSFAPLRSQQPASFAAQLQLAQTTSPVAQLASAHTDRSAAHSASASVLTSLPYSSTRSHQYLPSQTECDSDSSEENLIGTATSDMQAGAPPTAPPPIDYSSWKTDDLRKECTRRKLRLPKNSKKNDRVNALLRFDAAKQAYAKKITGDGMELVCQDETRSKHCMFRLINILFSDEFAERFCRTVDTATRTELDGKLLNERSDFWMDVRASFVEECADDDERNLLAFSGDDFFLGINPALAKRVHSAKRLYSMWKEVNKNYFDAQSKFSCSGQNDNDFRNFVNGRGDVLYLQTWLQQKPELTNFVKGGLLSREELDTMDPRTLVRDELSTVMNLTPSKRKSHEALGLMATSFSEYVSDRRDDAKREFSTNRLQEWSQILNLLADSGSLRSLAAKP